jgi:hypothetical protein
VIAIIRIKNKEKNMENKYKIVTVCGSTRLKDLILKKSKELTLEGNIVLLPLVFSGSGDIITDEERKMLVEMHKEKINISDEVYFIFEDGSAGESVSDEINFAMKLDKPCFICDYNKDGSLFQTVTGLEYKRIIRGALMRSYLD